MSATSENQRATSAITANHVVAYLREHPEFFAEHPGLLETLSLAHESGNAVSLLERQVAVLRGRNIDMRQELDTLVRNARDNDQLFARTRHLILAALEAADLDSLAHTVNVELKQQIGIDEISIVLFDAPGAAHAFRTDTETSARAAIHSILETNQAVCGILRDAESSYLFPDQSAASAAVAPLTFDGRMLGVLALGSRDPQRFVSGMGTMFLRYLADVLSRLLVRLL